MWSNPLLLGGISFELAFTGAVIYVPWLQDVFGTTSLGANQLALLLPFPVIVWGVDEFVRATRRRRHAGAVLVGCGPSALTAPQPV